jgi:hypothetical protein
MICAIGHELEMPVAWYTFASTAERAKFQAFLKEPRGKFPHPALDIADIMSYLGITDNPSTSPTAD